MTEKHPLHGTINKTFDKAPAAVIDSLAAYGTATLVDCMGGSGFMHHEIKPLLTDYRIAGSAFTVMTKPGDVLYCKAALDLVSPGDIVVIDAGGVKEAAVFGDRFAEALVRRGASGIVIDGVVRDSQGVIDSGLPCFCRGSCIPYLTSVGPGAINVSVSCGGTVVTPGDVLIGDRDGVVVIPRSAAETALDLAEKHIEAEVLRAERMQAGESAYEVYGLKRFFPDGY